MRPPRDKVGIPHARRALVEWLIWLVGWLPAVFLLPWEVAAGWACFFGGYWIGKAVYYGRGLKDAVLIREYARKEVLEQDRQRYEAAPFN